MSNGFLLGTVFASLLFTVSATYVSVSSNGYQDVVIRVDENAGTDCRSTVEEIKALVQNMSATWSQALDPPLYFGNVAIVMPDAWKTDCRALLTGNVSEYSWVRLHKADFVITPSHPVFGLMPFSFQYGDCGDPGLPIVVPWSANSTDDSRGKRLVREWAHYRYGVFDEGGQPWDGRHPSAYTALQTPGSKGFQRGIANTCSDKKTPRGHWNDDACQSSAYGACEFVPDNYNPDIHSSLMYRPELSHMYKFCDESSHDPIAPSKLNYYCDGKSATSVIKQHADYKTPLSGFANTTFSVILNPFIGYHIILDTGSFDEQTFKYARKSLIQFISHLPDGVVLSIDLFNSTLTIFQEPIALTGEMKLNLLANLTAVKWRLDTSYQGLTRALDRGLLMAQNGQDVIMMTMLPAKLSTFNFNDYVTRYQASKVNLHLMYYPPSTSKEIIQLADLSKHGSFHFIPNSDPPIGDWLNGMTWSVGTLQTIFSRTSSHRPKIFEISTKRNTGSDVSRSGSFYLDSPASKLLCSLYFVTNDLIVSMKSFLLYKPNGEVIDVDQDLTVNENEGMYLFRLEADKGSSLDEGDWRYEIKLSSGSDLGTIRFDVWAEPDASEGSFIELHTWNSALDQKPWDAASKPMGLYAKLTQNGKPVQNVTVTAHVYAIADRSSYSSTKIASIPLLDEGLADVTTGDGIYSGWMTAISNASLSYAIKFEAYAVGNGSALVDNGTFDRQPTTGSEITMSEPVPAVEQFKRFQYGPGFQLTSATSNNVDYIPPARITDLSRNYYSQTTGELTMVWTAPKDNFGSGSKVTRFTLVTTRSNGIEETTTFTRDVTDDYGRLNYSVIVPSAEQGGYVMYRIFGIDGNNNKGKPSNAVSIVGPLPPVGLAAWAWGLIGVAIAIVVIIVIILVICYLCPDKARARKRKAAKTVRQIFEMPARKKDKKETEDVPRDWRSPSQMANQTNSIDRTDPENSKMPSAQASERMYFSKRDIDEMTSGTRSESGSFAEDYERGSEYVVKRAPSMNMQLAAILEMNNSNLSLDRAGVEPSQQKQQAKPKQEVVIQPKIYKTRPVSHQPYGAQPSNNSDNTRPLSTSETNLYHQSDVVQVRRNPGNSAVSPSNSYLSVFAEPRTEANRAGPQQPNRPDSRNDNWNSQRPFSYTDTRLAGQPRGQSSFDPVNHPANQVGLPAPQAVPRGIERDSDSSSQSDWSAGGVRPKRVSAV